MAISANVSAAEVTSSVSQRYLGQYFEAALINAPGVTYIPGSTVDATFMAFEVPLATAGYSREVFNYVSADLAPYSDRGVPLATKITTFPHDGTVTEINFTHVALLWGGGNTVALGPATSEPTNGNDGIYTNLPTQTDGDGTGLLIDLTISNNIFVYSIAKPGSGYAPGDAVSILGADLVSVGAVEAAEEANAVMSIANISSGDNAGQVVAVVEPTTAVVLTAGNEATFFWNLKTYGAS